MHKAFSSPHVTGAQHSPTVGHRPCSAGVRGRAGPGPAPYPVSKSWSGTEAAHGIPLERVMDLPLEHAPREPWEEPLMSLAESLLRVPAVLQSELPLTPRWLSQGASGFGSESLILDSCRERSVTMSGNYLPELCVVYPLCPQTWIQYDSIQLLYTMGQS